MMQSRIPVLIEPPDHHSPAGGNILFMDGHVEFMKYVANSGIPMFPMDKESMDILKSLSALKGSAPPK